MLNEQLLPHTQAAPIDINSMVEETTQAHSDPWQHTWPPGTRRRTLAVEPSTGGAMFLLYLPAGYGRPEEAEHAHTSPLGRFERHSCHEEIFNLGGRYRFGDWYDFPALGYVNHPPNWVHPADQATPDGVLLLIKNSCPVDFTFDPIPDDWDGAEGVDDGTGSLIDTGGLTMLDVEACPWGVVRDKHGAATGMEAKHLWRDANTGWSTWIMRVPPGWEDAGPVSQVAGGDEMFLLEGDFTHARHGQLLAQSYFCDSDMISIGRERSREGCLAIRWTKGEGVLTLPAIVDQRRGARDD